MNYQEFPYHIFPLGDAAITVDFGNCIDIAINKEVIARFNQLQQLPLPGMIEAVPAYCSLTVYYDTIALKKKVPSHQTYMNGCGYNWKKDYNNRYSKIK